MRPNPIPLITICLLVSLAGFTQDSFPYTLLLKSGPITPEKNISQDALSRIGQTGARVDGKTFAIIQFENLPGPAEIAELSRQGITLLDYIPNNAYTVTISGVLQPDVLGRSGARAVIELSPQQKMQPELFHGDFPSWSVKVAGTVDVWISFPRTFTLGTVSKELSIRNFDILPSDFTQYRIMALRVPVTRLGELAGLPFVEFVQSSPPGDQPLNYNSMYLSKANILRAPLALGGKDLLGRNVVVGIGDDGDPQTHLDFTGRLINRAAEIPKAHASHVTGTVGGAGIIQELYTGYAPKSTIISQVFSRIITNAPVYVQDHGMVITNNSYGSISNDCAYNGFYDLTSRILDQQAFDLPELQHVFASGNDGFLTCNPNLAGFKTVLGGYQSAKNVLTVGSTDLKGMISDFSSKGPVRDGRLKPEIMAQGQFLASTWINNQYSYNNGTSMAAPGISGGLALLVELYRDLNGNANPKNGLLKALLCNGGYDRGNAGPDYTYGFGTMDLLRTSKMMEDATYFIANATTGSNTTQSISVPANTAQLKVLVYWQDPPASLLSSKTLVNDIDLQVQGPGGTVLPVRLDSTRQNINNPATTGPDHHNNIEQVIINNPAAGNYDLRVLGTAIPQGPNQEYFLVYDIVPQNLELINPRGGESFVPTTSVLGIDTVYVHWDSYGGPASSFTLEFFNGLAWSALNNGNPIAASQRVYSWVVPTGVATDAARIRITKTIGGATQTSLPFTITALPFDSLTPVQCEGYIQLGWRSVPGATDYEVMMLQGDEMVPVATTTLLYHVFSGLSKDSVYWVAVRPRINGNPGRRANAVSRQPNTGTCAGALSDNDLKIDAILSPVSSGREFTSTSLSAATPVTIRIKNLDNAVSNANITVSYSLNGGTPVTTILSGAGATIAAGGTLVYTFPGTVDLSTPGDYSLEVSATKATDPVTANNSLVKVFRQLENEPIENADLPWLDNLETAAVQSVTTDQLGLAGRDRYDFFNSTANGRLRTFINSGIAYSGNRAITLDISRYLLAGNIDSLTGTFNLQDFTTTDDIRLDFRFKNHGQKTNPANAVWIRGSDTDPWIPIYNLFANQPDPDGSWKLSNSLELADTLDAHGQDFSSSFQVRWGQWGQHMTADNESAAGYSFDDIRIYRAIEDIQMLAIDTPRTAVCGLSNAVNVKVVLRNTTDIDVINVPVFLRVDGNIVASELVPLIPANDTIHYIFDPGADLSLPGAHLIESWVDYGSDNVPDNDTAQLTVKSLPLIASYPYLEDFEAGDGNWYTLPGSAGSWEFGQPVSAKINRAASGTKGWKTNLAGYYGSMELSYLYSPCFDLSSMTTPTLSFSLALDLEDCGATLCDAAWVEISSDGGLTWAKLGASGQGTNWYNKNYAGNHVWSRQDYTRWHVATIPLPVTGNSNIKFRFVFDSDEGLSKDGIAIDDIHIYDNIYGIYDITGASPVVNQSSVNGTGWIDFIETGTNKLIASVNPNGEDLGSTDVQSFVNAGPVRINSDQYYHDRNITIKPAIVSPADSVTVRFYFLDSEAEALINATGCGYCFKPAMAYDLGVSKYSDVDDNRENGTIDDNIPGNYLFINQEKVTLVPFDKGYYAEFKVKDFSEFWLNNGGFDLNQPLPVELLSFTASKNDLTRDVVARWVTASELNVDRFELEVAKGNSALQQDLFVKLGEVASQGNSASDQHYNFTDTEQNKSGVRYYRLKVIDLDGSFTYSPIRSVMFSEEIEWTVSPNPSAGLFILGFQAAEGQVMEVKVYDAGGRIVYRESVQASGFVQKTRIDLQAKGLPAGLYLLEAGNGTSRRSFKLLKQ